MLVGARKLASEVALAVLLPKQAIDLGVFAVRFIPPVAPADSAYVIALLRAILPAMVAVLGPPRGLDTLSVSVDDAGWYGGRVLVMPPLHALAGIDDDGDGLIDEDPYDERDDDGDGRVDEDIAFDTRWDGIFIHELTHAFLTGSSIEFWFQVGMATAVPTFVCERATSIARERRFQYEDAVERPAVIDLFDRADSPEKADPIAITSVGEVVTLRVILEPE